MRNFPEARERERQELYPYVARACIVLYYILLYYIKLLTILIFTIHQSSQCQKFRADTNYRNEPPMGRRVAKTDRRRREGGHLDNGKENR